MNKIVLTDQNGSLIVNEDEIVYCEAHNCYSFFHLSNGKKRIVCKTLKEFERELCADLFVRVHRKYIINMDHIRYFERKLNSKVWMTNGTGIEISFRKKKHFLSKFSKHMDREGKMTLTKSNLTFT